MPDAFINRLSCGISNTPGATGAFTIGAARSGFRAFRAADNGLTFTVVIEEGTAWEVRNGCTYTHAGTSLSRGVLEDSSTGAAIAFTAAAVVSAALSARGLYRVARDAVRVSPTGTTADSANMQAAANEAMGSGVPLVLAAGDWDISSADVVFGTGPDLFPGDAVRSGTEYKALEIYGEGRGRTRIRVAGNRRGLFFANDTGAIGKHGIIKGLSLLGTGINAGGIGIQLGGRSAVRSDLLENFLIEDVEFDNLTSCLIADDVTCLHIVRARFGRFKYGCEWGYNIDDIEIVQALWGYNDGLLNGAACTITNGSNSITLPPGITSRIQVGYAVSTGSQKCFPRESYVGSIVGNTITVVNFNGAAVNALANGTSINFFLGRCVVFGASAVGTTGSLYPSIGSTFTSPYWSSIYPAQRGRISATNHFYGGAAGSVERFLDIGHLSHAAIVSRTYLERTCEGYELGDPGAAGVSPGPIILENAYWGFKHTMAAPFVNILSDDLNCNLTVRGNFNDGAPDNEPWIQGLGYGGNEGQLTWEQNRLPGSRTGKFLSASDTFSAQPVVPPNGAMYLGTARRGDAVQTWLHPAWMYAGQDGLSIDLSTGAKTVNNPADMQYGTAMRGKDLTLYLTAGTGNALTLGSMFRGVNGAELGTIAAGTTGQRMILPFLYDPTVPRFLARIAPQWV